MNQLDLAKVGKAFGFAVPPRVNVNVGPGRGTSNATNKKRRREEGGGGDEEGVQGEQGEEEEEVSRKDVRRENKQRRIEVEGRKKVGKEMYKKGQARQRLEAAGQWSR